MPIRVKIAVAIASLVLVAISRDSLLFFFGMSVVICLVSMFYNRLQPPVVLYAAVIAWFFFQGQLFNALIQGEDIVTLDYFSPTKPTIISLGLLAVLVFFTGMYLTSRSLRVVSYEEIKSFLMRVNLDRLFLIYVVAYVGLSFLGTSLWMLGGFAQPLVVLSQFKWALFYLLFVTVMVQDRRKFWLFALILVDIALSFFSFFAHFKEAIYFSFLAYWMFFFRSSVSAKVTTIVCIILTFYLGAYWTAIKEDYRNFLNRGTGAQALRVTREEAYSKLSDLVVNLKPEQFDAGVEDLVTRLSWIRAFDAVYNYVPEKVPHENGDLWAEGLTRPFLPRLFFPGKKALTDSRELNIYSGLDVDEKNTSISLSMVAGSYVDFGSVGMFIPLFLFGLFSGWLYKKTVQMGRYPVIGYAFTMPFFYLVQINEQSINRTVSTFVLFFLVLWFISRFVLNTFLRFILVPKKQVVIHVNPKPVVQMAEPS